MYGISKTVIGYLCSYVKRSALVASLFVCITWANVSDLQAQIVVQIDDVVFKAEPEQDSVVVAPNPIIDYVHVSVISTGGVQKFEVFDLGGSKLFESNVSFLPVEYSVNLSPGTYLFMITTNQGIISKQVVVTLE